MQNWTEIVECLENLLSHFICGVNAEKKRRREVEILKITSSKSWALSGDKESVIAKETLTRSTKGNRMGSRARSFTSAALSSSSSSNLTTVASG